MDGDVSTYLKQMNPKSQSFKDYPMAKGTSADIEAATDVHPTLPEIVNSVAGGMHKPSGALFPRARRIDDRVECRFLQLPSLAQGTSPKCYTEEGRI